MPNTLAPGRVRVARTASVKPGGALQSPCEALVKAQAVCESRPLHDFAALFLYSRDVKAGSGRTERESDLSL